MQELVMVFLENVAFGLGVGHMIAGSIGLAAWSIYKPINYAWRKFGDIVLIQKVLIEARRQGRPILKRDKS